MGLPPAEETERKLSPRPPHGSMDQECFQLMLEQLRHSIRTSLFMYYANYSIVIEITTSLSVRKFYDRLAGGIEQLAESHLLSSRQGRNSQLFLVTCSTRRGAWSLPPPLLPPPPLPPPLHLLLRYSDQFFLYSFAV